MKVTPESVRQGIRSVGIHLTKASRLLDADDDLDEAIDEAVAILEGVQRAIARLWRSLHEIEQKERAALTAALHKQIEKYNQLLEEASSR